MLLPGIGDICDSPVAMAAAGLTIEIFDERGDRLEDADGNPTNVIGIEYLDQNLTYSVTNNFDPNTGEVCGNSCWGNIRVEYKQVPQLVCPDTMIMTCAALDVMCLPGFLNLEEQCFTSSFEVILSHEERDAITCGELGDDLYTHIVTREYQVRDENGVIVSDCNQTIFLERVVAQDIKYPESVSIRCSELGFFDLNENGCPEPWLPIDDLDISFGLPYTMLMPGAMTGSGTGSGTPGFVPDICVPGMEPQSAYGPHDLPPVMGGGTGSGTGSGTPGNPLFVPLFPGSTSTCNGFVTFTDVLLPEIGCTKKFIRTWEVLEWHCGEETVIPGIPQIIEIIDDAAPVIEDCPAPFEVTTNDDCAGDILLPTIVATDDCGNGVQIAIEHPWGRIEVEPGVEPRATLQTGKHVVTYFAEDECHNISSCSTVVTIRDNTQPVAICEQNTVVSISLDGNTIVDSNVFDDGSWDECGPVSTCAVKMSDVLFFRSLDADTLIDGIKYVLQSRMDRGCAPEYLDGIEVDGVTYLSEDDLCVPYVLSLIHI